MEINTKHAVKYFFANPSLEMVYIEAIANALDANADKIDIEISIDEFSKPESLRIRIADNGDGFTDQRYYKFTKVMEFDDDSHKGLGRLVFLSYFTNVDITSWFDHKERKIPFSDQFKKEDGKKIVTISEDKHGSVLEFNGYHLKKIKARDYLKPDALKNRILQEFYPLFYSLKQDNRYIEINISLFVDQPNERYGFETSTATISTKEMGDLIKIELDDQINMFDKMELHYSITPNRSTLSNTVITAICIDGRTYNLEIIDKENIPVGYDIIFLLYSDFFKGQVNASRQELTMNDSAFKAVKKIFRKNVAQLLGAQIPSVEEHNKQVKHSLIQHYPHLLGYFEEDTIGFASRTDAIRDAQDKFFRDQKEILDATDLTDEKYDKTIELSSRTLTQYILYRQITIKKLRKNKQSEADIHNLIVPMKKRYNGEECHNDLFSNNAWLLDDRYMTYTAVLSDRDMCELAEVLNGGDELVKGESFPDIAIVFSSDPKTSEKFDVVIVELKKKGIPLARTEEVISQLRQRARRLLKHYNEKIQRIWFYGIVEFTDEFIDSLLENKFNPLFSKGQLYYNEIDVTVNRETQTMLPIGVYIMSIDAFIDDADARNSAFLNVLRSHFLNKE